MLFIVGYHIVLYVYIPVVLLQEFHCSVSGYVTIKHSCHLKDVVATVQIYLIGREPYACCIQYLALGQCVKFND